MNNPQTKMPAMTPNLREFHPSATQAKNVDQTNMLDTEAHEPPEHVTATNNTDEYVVSHGPFGKLGAVGRE